MKTRSAMGLLASAVVAWTSLSISDATETGRDTTVPTDPPLAMVAVLGATGPHSSLGDQARVFGRLVGTWDVAYTDFSKDGKALHRSGEFIVGWVLDGRAIEDVWIVYPSGGRKDREVYADVRYFDPKSGTWPAIFFDPEHASMARFTGGAAGDDQIVLDSADLGHETTRWSFEHIQADTLVFRDQASDDGGRTWRLQSEYHMKRRGPVASSR